MPIKDAQGGGRTKIEWLWNGYGEGERSEFFTFWRMSLMNNPFGVMFLF